MRPFLFFVLMLSVDVARSQGPVTLVRQPSASELSMDAEVVGPAPLPYQAVRIAIRCTNLTDRPLGPIYPPYVARSLRSVERADSEEPGVIRGWVEQTKESEYFEDLGKRWRMDPTWLDSGKSVTASRSYAASWSRSSDLTSLFDRPGSYTLRFGYPPSRSKITTHIEVNVISPPKADQPIVALLRGDAPLRRAMLSKEDVPTGNVHQRLQQLVAQHPRSTYADYARFALARAAIAGGDTQQARALLEGIDAEHFPHGPQVLLALRDLLDPREQQLRLDIAQKLKRHFPHAAEVEAAAANAMTDADWKALQEALVTPRVPDGAREIKPIWRYHACTGAVEEIAVSPHGDSVVTTDQRGSIRTWDWSNKKWRNKSYAHKGPVTSLFFLDEGKRYISCSHDGTVGVWSTDESVRLEQFETGTTILGLALNPQKTHFAAAYATRPYNSQCVGIWDLQTKKKLRDIVKSSEATRSLDYSPDGQWLALAKFDGTVTLLPCVDDRETIILRQEEALFYRLDFSPNSKILATGTLRGNVWLWDVDTGKPLELLRGHKHNVWTLQFSPDGRFLATGGPDRCAKLWDVATRKEIAVLHAKEGIRSLAFTPNGRSLLGGEVGGHLVEWDLSEWYPRDEP